MKVSPEKKAAFCKALAEGCTISAAAVAVGVAPKTVYEWRKQDAAFAEDWEGAIESGTDLLEAEAQRRALSGSDVLLIFLLKGRRPDKFRERTQTEIVDKTNAEPSSLSDAELNARLARVAAEIDRRLARENKSGGRPN